MRLLPNWIDGFEEFSDHLPSPLIFRRWGAIAAIAGALERKVWLRSLGMDLYPHLYTVLVAPPGIGKSVITTAIEKLWRGLTTHHVAPKSLSKASLIDSLAEAKRAKTVISGDSLYLEFNSLLVNAGELSVLIPAYDSEFMAALTGIWDGDHYEERRRGNNLHIVIKKPQINLLGATTPSYLNGVLPEGAWDQGFLARTFLIYSGERITRDIFSEAQMSGELLSKLSSDLRDIADMAGPFLWELPAREAMKEWHLAGGPPIPDHPKLTHYLTRRSAHLMKLCMIAAAAESSDRVIRLRHYQTALDWLLSMEAALPDIFKALGSRGDGQTIEEVYHFLYQFYTARKEPMAEHRLISFIAERVPSYSVLRIVEIMEKSGQIEKSITSAGTIGYIPCKKF